MVNNHVRFRVNLKHLQGMNLKIFFNHGEQIVYLFCQFSQYRPVGKMGIREATPPGGPKWLLNALNFRNFDS